MEHINVLSGHSSRETAYQLPNHPYGYNKTTTKYFWIETKGKLGDRLVTMTLDPDTGKENRPRAEVYHTFVFLRLDGDGQVLHGGFNFNSPELYQEQLVFIVHRVGIDKLTDQQKENIRKKIVARLLCDLPYGRKEYLPGELTAYESWANELITHFETCAFEHIADFPDEPQEKLAEFSREA